MKIEVGDLVEINWEVHEETHLKDFVGIVTGFDETGCAYVLSNVYFWQKTKNFTEEVAIPKDRLRIVG